MTLGLGMQHWGWCAYQVCSNNDPRATLTYFYPNSTQAPNRTSDLFSIRVFVCVWGGGGGGDSRGFIKKILQTWCSTSQSQFRYDVVTIIRGNRLNSAGIAQECITIGKITLEHAARKLRNQLRICLESRGGGVLWYFHTYVGTGYFLGFKILNFNIFGGFEKNEYFWGYKDFVDIFWGHHKIGLVWGSFQCLLGSFLRSRYKIGIFFGLLKFQIFFGVLEIPEFFGGWTVDAGSEPTYTEKIWVPPPPLGLEYAECSTNWARIRNPRRFATIREIFSLDSYKKKGPYTIHASGASVLNWIFLVKQL